MRRAEAILPELSWFYAGRGEPPLFDTDMSPLGCDLCEVYVWQQQSTTTNPGKHVCQVFDMCGLVYDTV